MLSVPPTNHRECGGCQSKLCSHFLNQCSSPSAKRAHEFSGFVVASARRFSSSSMDLMCACSEKLCGGWKRRSSCCNDSMLVVPDDMLRREAPFLRAWF